MAVYESTRPYALSAVLAGRVGYYITQAIAMFSTWNDARITRDALSRLTDRELEDIGLSRSDIGNVTGH